MSKSALVISGGGSKGAFAGGVAQYLIEETKQSLRPLSRDFNWELVGVSFSIK